MLAGQQRALSVRRPWANLIIAVRRPSRAGRGSRPAAARGLTGFDGPETCPNGYLGAVRLVEGRPGAVHFSRAETERLSAPFQTWRKAVIESFHQSEQ